MCTSAWAIQRCPWLAAAAAESLHAAIILPERNRLLRRHSVAFLLRTFLHFLAALNGVTGVGLAGAVSQRWHVTMRIFFGINVSFLKE